ncbi:hypothetical protein AVEN_216851-1 [Araneus ventricosus]|uniref:Uncharacterized protein n=1 Tax=Araneus ventricosus TaxID=182803 RepID=A0A4Y2TL21_ARAVE|nr:hypothetical protein AVEN_216851-1 [Araneus ventricosus]
MGIWIDLSSDACPVHRFWQARDLNGEDKYLTITFTWIIPRKLTVVPARLGKKAVDKKKELINTSQYHTKTNVGLAGLGLEELCERVENVCGKIG